ncbi:hypothetical protein [Ramlibacter sp. 2FC]|uniref:hypothetical protein n=1 Tax=Ramlibacter sp. 2FC TaxID=2502188 RepID=UPI0010F71224|nr:hypothetical protein [Ramlibacter sp. 2FC]
MEQKTTLEAKLCESDPMIQAYVRELEKANERLNDEIVKKDVKVIGLSNKVKALEKQLRENRPEFKIVMNLGDSDQGDERMP